MKLHASLIIGLAIAVLSSVPVFGDPPHASHAYHGGHGYYGHGYAYHGYPRYYYGHPHYYYGHGGYTTFGFGFGGVYAPGPVYVAPPPVYYEPPMAEGPPPVEQGAAEPAPPEGSGPPTTQEAPHFVETNRHYHKHGDNKGRLEWVEGLLDGRPTRIYYDDFGRIKEQKWMD